MSLVARPQERKLLQRASLDESNEEPLRRGNIFDRDRRVGFLNGRQSKVFLAGAMEKRLQRGAQFLAHTRRRTLAEQGVLVGISQEGFRGPQERERVPAGLR